MSYEPRPDTVAFRALAHMGLLHKGSEISTAVLAAGISVDPNALVTQLTRCVDERLIFRRQKGGHTRSPIFWSMVDHSAEVHAAPPPGPQTPMQKVQPIAATSHLVPELDIDAIHRKRDRVVEMETPQKGANRDASAGQSHDAAGSESPNGRGTNGASALGAAPAFEPLRDAWANIKFVNAPEASSVEAKPEVKQDTSTAGEGFFLDGPAPKPEVVNGDMLLGAWDNGTFHVVRHGMLDVWSVEHFRQLVRFLDSISLESVREAEA